MNKTFALAMALCLAFSPGCATAQTMAHAQFSFLEPEEVSIPVVNGVIMFEQDVTDESVAGFKKSLAAVLEDKPKSVVVQISTFGGSVSAGLEMEKALENAPVPVTCVVDGFALSMGLAILQSCDVRMMTGRSVLMGHQPANTSSGQINQHQNAADALRALNHAMAKQIVLKTHLSVEEYEAKIDGGKEFWITSDDAEKMGFVDFQVETVQEAVLLSGK